MILFRLPLMAFNVSRSSKLGRMQGRERKRERERERERDSERERRR